MSQFDNNLHAILSYSYVWNLQSLKYFTQNEITFMLHFEVLIRVRNWIKKSFCSDFSLVKIATFSFTDCRS